MPLCLAFTEDQVLGPDGWQIAVRKAHTGAPPSGSTCGLQMTPTLKCLHAGHVARRRHMEMELAKGYAHALAQALQVTRTALSQCCKLLIAVHFRPQA